MAGKFGTTDHNAAAWFCGYTPKTATAVVVYRASNRPLINIGDAPHQKAATVPAVIWRTFMTSAEAGQPVEVFPPPVFAGAVKNFAPPTPLPSTKAVPPPVRPALPSKKIPKVRPSVVRKAGRPTPSPPADKPTRPVAGDPVGGTG
jgi:membrane peptidoglycan carboxypeptidase